MPAGLCPTILSQESHSVSAHSVFYPSHPSFAQPPPKLKVSSPRRLHKAPTAQTRSIFATHQRVTTPGSNALNPEECVRYKGDLLMDNAYIH